MLKSDLETQLLHQTALLTYIPELMAIFTLRTESEEALPPDEGRAADIFSRLGYQFEDAVADLIDNSIDAGAEHVHVRFMRSSKGIHSVVIADDGSGMTEAQLREAMRFGSRNEKAGTQLGRYGIGLKSASLSQAVEVTVLSRQGKSMVGRRWTLGNIKRNWTCETLYRADVGKTFKATFGGFTIVRSGTVVIWEKLEHLQALPDNIDAVLQRAIRDLRVELGIRFHRFLASDKVRIGIDQQFGDEEPSELPIYVSPLDPFGYDRSPHRNYPLRLTFDIQHTRVTAECHIWPPKSGSPGYRLGGGKVALRQGFYFYRNGRIIQAGGWNGITKGDGEPHLSLARVKIDLPAKLDSIFKLDVTKSRLDPPPEFAAALLNAYSADRITFNQYIADATTSYRHQKVKDRARFPVIPGAGLPSKVKDEIAGVLREAGAGRPKKIALKWAKLPPGEVVRPDASGAALLLNARYKADLVEGESGDAPVLKMALMFLLQDELGKTFITKVAAEWIRRINQALLAAMKT